jgi:hypothetical protein
VHSPHSAQTAALNTGIRHRIKQLAGGLVPKRQPPDPLNSYGALHSVLREIHPLSIHSANQKNRQFSNGWFEAKPLRAKLT